MQETEVNKVECHPPMNEHLPIDSDAAKERATESVCLNLTLYPDVRDET